MQSEDVAAAAVPPPAAPVTTGSAAPRHSEATRLLCAGTYLDPVFRRRVLRELVEHGERTVAPSLGIDVVAVLGHALRSRGREAMTALWVLAVWAAFVLCDTTLAGDVPYAGVWALFYAVPCLLLWIAAVVGGRGGFDVYGAGPRSGGVRLWRGRVPLGLALRVLAYVQMALYWYLALFVLAEGAWTAVVFPLLLVWPVWMHRIWTERIARDELSPAGFPGAAPPTPADPYQPIAAAIAHEQYSRLTVYDFDRPFVGYGIPYEPWSLAVELKRRPGAPAGETLTSRRVVELILPRLGALRDATAADSRDRLKDLEVAHLVYLPPPPHRGDVRRDDATVDRHVGGSVDEGGEARRYFLRIRVGAWSEQVVVTILVRVHTQGGMLVLEVVPHVLPPVRPEFREIDRLAARGGGARTFARSLLAAPASSITAVVALFGTVASVFRTWLADAPRLPGEGPGTSVRELGVSPDLSLFQTMDVSRYVKTVRDRIASGVTEALRESGYETGEFEQYIVNVNEGGVYIGAMSGGAVASGRGATATVRSDAGGAGA
ncbi:hypothetical protein O7599_14415 [Streptomyces sp. WMMC500]|uniref:hypothetical protein n=1 Tax=Streptomyces sp. WMMC500 TaxID=3015154 RepID=UPI00248BED8B|nr:hypothetical protein [Streptomyces sp. WMMC500]WBB63637.1 hypothetical protein O7599_14415 [Streptomyces sp. WMMC500]